MGKISKDSNLYDKDDNLIREAPLKDYTIEELEKLADKLANDKDENGKIKDPDAFNNVMLWLFRMYQLKGVSYKDELIDKLNNTARPHTTSAEEVEEALEDVATQVEEEPVMDEYVDYETVA